MRDQLGLVRGRRLQKNSSNGDLLRALWSTWSTWSTWSILETTRRLLKKKNAHTHHRDDKKVNSTVPGMCGKRDDTVLGTYPVPG